LAKASQGRILFQGQEVGAWSIRRRMEAGMAYIPQDRRGSGLVLPFSVQENLALGRSHLPPLSSRGFLRFGALREQAETLIRDYDIRTESPGAAAATLSGGNQQKIILAREFSRRPAFLLVSQPTRGLDVGAIEYVYRRILELRARGTAILLVSMELEELFALSDRLVVLHEGRAVFESPREKTNLYEVGEYMIRGTTERNPA
jgi:simple sugar transport system ATP-binding protein